MYRIRWDRVGVLMMIITGFILYFLLEHEMANNIKPLYHVKAKLVLLATLFSGGLLYYYSPKY